LARDPADILSMRPELPPTHLPGAIPTLNETGFMLEALDQFAGQFVRDAATDGGEVLDIGCAYGVATLAALERGARVCACDMEPRHLELLEQRTPATDRARLRTVQGILPGVQFPPESFTAILASRVLHFLAGPELRSALASMRDWLKPGGVLYVVADTPYMPVWQSFVAEYEAAKARGAPWPGMITDFSRYWATRPDGTVQRGPAFLNTLDPDILARECIAAGLQVERAGFFAMDRLGAEAQGREHAGCIARKPQAGESRAAAL
jgi:SAM-dependent methyltransferase